MSLLTTLGTTSQKVIFKVRKVSPQIRTAAGIVGFFVAGAMIIVETRKAAPIFDEHKKKIEDIHRRKESGEIDKKDAGVEYLKTYKGSVRDLVKIYWRSGVVMAASTASIISATSSLVSALSSTTATLAALDGKFKLAEARTAEKYGKDVADELFYGIKKELVATKEIDSETGEEKDVVEEHIVVDKETLPLFTEFFDSSSREYEKNNHIYNKYFLEKKQEHFQNRVNARYFLTYNDMREDLGYDKLKSEYGMDWGYEYGDTVDLGLDDTSDEGMRRFLNGLEDVALIRFKGMHPLRKDLKQAYGYKKV